MRDFKCDLCAKSFSGKGDLKIHITRIYDGRLDFKCESCPKAYSFSGDTSYIGFYTLPDIFKENLMPSKWMKEIRKKSSLLLDLGIAKRLFFNDQILELHIKSVHQTGNDISKGKNHKCETCSKAFSFKSYLIRHISFVHEKKKKTSNVTCVTNLFQEILL